MIAWDYLGGRGTKSPARFFFLFTSRKYQWKVISAELFTSSPVSVVLSDSNFKLSFLSKHTMYIFPTTTIVYSHFHSDIALQCFLYLERKKRN